jgi:hypothetical protein
VYAGEDQEGDEIKMIGCFKATDTHRPRQWRGDIGYPHGRAKFRVGYYEAQTECGHPCS